jgi:phospholipase C
LSRRDLLRAGAAAGTLAAVGGVPSALADSAPRHKHHPHHHHHKVRHPDSRPFPHKPAGTVDHSMPFDHIVVLMMENHSFDHYLGLLPLHGQPKADGFRFRHGKPINSNPLGGKRVKVYPLHDPCQPDDSGSQSWHDSHVQINHGKMNGFARTGRGSMGYYTPETLPFYYGLAKTFTLANRWFCSTPAQTYPNRRFLMAGTAYGLVSTSTSSLDDPPPPNGTIFDRLSQHKISWRNYFSDLPATGIIASIIKKHPANITHITQFFSDAAAGRLPAVSFVDPEFGATDVVGGSIANSPNPLLNRYKRFVRSQGGDEENPQDVQIGQAFVASVVNAVMSSPNWPRTLLLWTYDEHGGYYDHVPPPHVLAPDKIKPVLSATDPKGTYKLLGPRVPAVVVSPHSKPNAVTNVVHDHTSVLATIERKWNLPAMTYRDANAATMLDFLDLKGRPHFLDPPKLPKAPNPATTEGNCDATQPTGG